MKIGIVGCAGRMGQMLVAEVQAQEGLSLAGGTETSGHSALGQDVALQVGSEPARQPITDDTQALFAAADVIIDFTLPTATRGHAGLAAELGTALVIGTTGLSPEDQKALEDAAKNTVIVQAANMSVGVNVLLGLTEQAAQILGDDYDIEIIEMHHRHKVDAPSGTALALGQSAATGRQVNLEDSSVRVRDGHTGARQQGTIGFATLRGGDVAGDHTVVFAGDGERIELTHKASSRSVFARGAIHAARWTQGQEPGLYSMRDVLGLS